MLNGQNVDDGIDVDVEKREAYHWLVVNIRGNDISTGNDWFEYKDINPPMSTDWKAINEAGKYTERPEIWSIISGRSEAAGPNRKKSLYMDPVIDASDATAIVKTKPSLHVNGV
ncbi:hypothetical protein RF11_15647 [Thelohanellus kitauei]|uniref:Uncharacterized protein n=1 Tax=Thelohanellus kitauei TaxID=669202 RepID=A0A0C2MU11_THEKT|nr:hypothetical protein RF11_15647 [Thelohanellus kitauei]